MKSIYPWQKLSHLQIALYSFRYLRAVAYGSRWLIKWMCGLLGWENTRPLPVCVYNFIRKTYASADTTGYIPAEQRS
jgi:hypothetical protein